jgi:hypothetical protein
MKMLFAGVLLASASACSNRQPVVIDGSSAEAFERTVADARRDIPDADRLVFDRAIRGIRGRSFSTKDPDALARVTFNGMTAAEVVADQRARE